MRLPQIRLESQMAKIAIQQTQGRQSIEQPKADLSIEQPKADMSIQTKPAKLSIDQMQAWEEMNLMSTPRFIEKLAQEGHAAVYEGMERRAQQGTDLMKIEDQGNPLVEQAGINAFRQMKQISLTYIPSPFSVKIDVEPAQLEIDTVTNQPIIQARANQPIHHFEPGSTQAYVQQYEQLNIDFINLFSEQI